MISKQNKEVFIMILRDVLDLVNKEKRKKERVKAVQKFALGMGVVAAVGVATGILLAPKSGKETREDLKNKAVNTAETIKDTVRKKAEAVKDSAAHAAQEVRNVMKVVHEKTEGVKKDIENGFHEITEDIHKTAENISNELNKSVK
jgi:gas vesicle protein